jgi:7,8-dihydropterin-6-yl-methyl-4-(beta-D-ribofuranosyl)aminobenzene 5'-phosphate synthase
MKLISIVDDRAQPDSGFLAEHGASFVIDNGQETVLLDAGGSSQVLLHNLAAAGVEPSAIQALILSHAHNDHTGGLPGLLDQVPGLDVYAHCDLFRQRFRKTDTGPRCIGPAVDRRALSGRAVLHLSADPVEVAAGVWTSGEIALRPEPEGRSVHHVVRQRRAWVPDPYADDMSVVLKTRAGLVLVCGCCHAGLLNTLAHVRRAFGADPVAVVGGTHLVHADSPTMEHIVEELTRYGPPQFWVGHCTGDRAFLDLKAAFGDQVSLYRAGSELSF